MKICVISPHFPPMSYPCGASHFAHSYATELASAGHEVTVLTSNKASKPDNNDKYKVKVIEGNWGFFHMLKIKKFLNSSSFDLFDIQFEVYMYGRKGSVLLLPYLVKSQIRPILTMHSEGLPKIASKFWRFIQYKAFKKVVFYSESFRKNALKRFPHRGSDFKKLGFPSNITKIEKSGLKSFIEKLKSDELRQNPLAVYFGHINQNRGIEDMFQVLSELKKEGTQFKLILMSQFDAEKNQYHRELLQRIESEGLEDDISFTGRVDDVVVSKVLQSADFALLPFSDGASFKNGSLASAVIHSLPMVTTLSEGTEQELKECSGIHFYGPGKTEEMKSVLKNFLNSKGNWNDYAKEVSKLATLYSWGNYLKERESLYGEALNA